MENNLQKWIELYYETPERGDDFVQLRDDIYDGAYEQYTSPIYPAREKVFTAMELVAPEEVKVVIIGQDPYHTPGQAQGLSFSLPDGAKTQPSMRNILKELKDDIGIERTSQDLTGWAKQGVLLLNRSLTVEEGTPNGMTNLWVSVTNKLVELIARLPQPIIFVLWGKNAQELETIVAGRKPCLKAAHPSPFSAYRGFFGTKPFSQINQYLEENGGTPIDWSK
jgi:uracil-DNA glycosylase